MTASNSTKRRGVLYFGLFLSLVVPVSGLGGAALHIPGVPPLAGQEAFFWSLATLVLLFILTGRTPATLVGRIPPAGLEDAGSSASAVASSSWRSPARSSFSVLPLFHLHQDPSAIKRMLDYPVLVSRRDRHARCFRAKSS